MIQHGPISYQSPGGGGGTLIFSYIDEYFWGYENFVDIFWGSSQNWTIF